MAKENIGHIDCPACGEQANVRVSTAGKAYIMCPSPVCGFQGFARGGDSDKHIRAKMRPVTNNPPPAQATGKPAVTPPASPKAPEQPPKRKGFFDDLLIS